MEFAFIIAFMVLLCFAYVLRFGAPYVPTMKLPGITALDLLDLKPGQTLLELGAGDGTMAVLALRRGIRVTAIELNPILCVIMWLRTRRYRGKIRIIWGNFWTTSWGEYDAIYTFLLDKYMKRLDKYIIQQNKNTKLASYCFRISGKRPIVTKNGVRLYVYKDQRRGLYA